MRMSFLLPLVAGLGLTGAALAQADAPPAATATQPVATLDTPVGQLLDNSATKAVLDKDMPGLSTSPHLAMARTMSLRQIAQYPQAKLTPAKLQMIQADLDAATGASATTPAAQPPAEPSALPPMAPPSPPTTSAQR